MGFLPIIMFSNEHLSFKGPFNQKTKGQAIEGPKKFSLLTVHRLVPLYSVQIGVVKL